MLWAFSVCQVRTGSLIFGLIRSRKCWRACRSERNLSSLRLACSRLSVVKNERKKKKRGRGREKNKGGLRWGREGREPVRISLMTLFHPPLVYEASESENVNFSASWKCFPIYRARKWVICERESHLTACSQRTASRCGQEKKISEQS